MAGRIGGFGTSIFAEMSALAREHNAVNLGQGFPDFDGPPEIAAAVSRAIQAGHNQYAISFGEPALRNAIAQHAARWYTHAIDPQTEITVTSGATEAIFAAVLAFVDPGDEVIVFEPCYDSYVPCITMAGGVAVPVTLHAPLFRYNPDELRAAFSPRTKAIIVNTPHNPSGTVFTPTELQLIAELCQAHDVLAITDEVYEHIVYAGAGHTRLATLDGMHDRTLTISSGGKTFSFTGWKIGWAMGAAPLQTALRRVHQFSVFATSTPMQYAIAEALALPDAYYNELAADYQHRRDYLMTALADCRLQPQAPQGSYFILANIGHLGAGNGADFCRHLVREIGVAAIPLDSFYLRPEHGEQWIRFCFCKQWKTLAAAAERLANMSTASYNRTMP